MSPLALSRFWPAEFLPARRGQESAGRRTAQRAIPTTARRRKRPTGRARPAPTAPRLAGKKCAGQKGGTQLRSNPWPHFGQTTHRPAGGRLAVACVPQPVARHRLRGATHVYAGEQTPFSLSSPAILSRPQDTHYETSRFTHHFIGFDFIAARFGIFRTKQCTSIADTSAHRLGCQKAHPVWTCDDEQAGDFSFTSCVGWHREGHGLHRHGLYCPQH